MINITIRHYEHREFQYGLKNKLITMATLTFLSESKGFRYESGNYILTGNKVVRNDNFESIDGGAILKDEQHIGTFYIRMEEDPKITISNVGLSEHQTVLELVKDLIDELCQ